MVVVKTIKQSKHIRNNEDEYHILSSLGRIFGERTFRHTFSSKVSSFLGLGGPSSILLVGDSTVEAVVLVVVSDIFVVGKLEEAPMMSRFVSD